VVGRGGGATLPADLVVRSVGYRGFAADRHPLRRQHWSRSTRRRAL
jgi:hypothetical protein